MPITGLNDGNWKPTPRPAPLNWWKYGSGWRKSLFPSTSKASSRSQPKLASVCRRLSDDELLGYGVPAEWLEDVRAADEDSLLELADHLPGEAAEALLNLATGATPQSIRQFAVRC